MPNATILVVDDDPTLLELIQDHLRKAGYVPLIAKNGNQGLKLFAQESPHLVILDVMMPNKDGWKVCEQIRTSSDVPIIMLTAKDQEIDKLRAFRLGVDDYVTKPFSFAELLARVGAVLHRGERNPRRTVVIRSGNLQIDLSRRLVLRSDLRVELTPIEYRLLEALVRHPNRVIPTEGLLSEVWGEQYMGENKHVKHYIWSLRNKLEDDPGDPQHFITDRGFGYHFE